VSGCTNKAGTPEELLKAIRSLLAGRHYVSDTLAEELAGLANIKGGKRDSSPCNSMTI
jgi:DNA-binding NarL/FixJ family response regulator